MIETEQRARRSPEKIGKSSSPLFYLPPSSRLPVCEWVHSKAQKRVRFHSFSWKLTHPLLFVCLFTHLLLPTPNTPFTVSLSTPFFPSLSGSVLYTRCPFNNLIKKNIVLWEHWHTSAFCQTWPVNFFFLFCSNRKFWKTDWEALRLAIKC